MTQQTLTPDSAIRPSPFKTILLAWFLAGTLDAAAAVGNYLIATGGNPIRVFQFIASGVFGREAFSGGMTMALWGGFFHYAIALGWTVFFFIMYPKIPILARNKYLTGLAYGLFVWLAMNFVVLPLSNVNRAPFDFMRAIQGIAILMACVGLPISLVVGKYYRARLPASQREG